MFSNISWNPIHPTRCKINVNRLDRMTITLADQNGVGLDISGGSLKANELWIVTLLTFERERFM